MPTINRADLYDTRRHKWVVRRCRCGRCKQAGKRNWVALQPEGSRLGSRAFDTWGDAMSYAAAASVPLQLPVLSPWPERPMRRGRLGLWL